MVVTVKLPQKVVVKLDGEAKRLGVTRSALIREAVGARLSAAVPAADQPSCLDLVEDLVGTVEGPRSLSSNPRHLADYGT